MDSFNGTWIDLADTEITVVEKDGKVEVKYSNGRGPFNGYTLYETPNGRLAAPVIDVNFTDDKPGTGVLAQGGGAIYWDNGTQWRR